MSNLRHLLKRAGMTGDQLSEAIGVNARTVSHHFNTGRMPFVIIWKIHKATKIPLNELVPKHVAEYWESLFDESAATNKPRGRKAGWKLPEEGVPAPMPAGPTLRERVINAPRETPSLPKSPNKGEKKTAPDPVPVSPPAQKPQKRSVADIMKEAGQTLEPEGPDGPAPDFSKLDDSVFATSADPAQQPKFRK